jgi:nucleoside-diphosphate-sugar epimerase
LLAFIIPSRINTINISLLLTAGDSAKDSSPNHIQQPPATIITLNTDNQSPYPNSAMAGDLVFATGGSGLIGIKTIQLLLKSGYTVRAAVRNQAKADAILATPTIKALNPGSRLEFAIVPDMLADNPYDEAIKGAKYAIHMASTTIKGEGFKEDQYESELVQPALRGTASILSAAYKTPTIKRVVITSSEVAIIPWEEFIAKEVDTVFDDTYQIPFPAGPYHHMFEAYAAGKVRSLVATKEFIAEKKPAWDVINIMPSFVIGENELITEPLGLCDGTNAAMFAQVLGKDSGWGAVPGTSILVDDVARLHVEALDPRIPGNQSFLAVSEGERGTVWEDAIEIVNRNFPEAVKMGVLPNSGAAATKRTKIDSSRTEKVFGWKFSSYEDQVKSVVKQYLGMLGEVAA